MKKLLILTTYFPPAAEIAAARLVGIIKYLLRLGWEVHVVTEIDRDYNYSADPVLGKIKIYAASTLARGSDLARGAPSVGVSLKNAVKRLRLPPALTKQIKSVINLIKYSRWRAKAYALASKAIEKYQIDTVIATVPRMDPAFVGSRIKKKIPSIKLVCEYRDIISGNIIYKSIQSRLEIFFTEIMEKSAINAADGFVYLTEGIKSRYMQYKSHNAAISNGIVLTNGYDGELCRAAGLGRDNSRKLVINHVGHFYGSRSAILFSTAFAQLSQEKPQIADSVSLNFIGKMDFDERSELLRLRKEHELCNLTVAGPVDHDRAIGIMAASDVNLIITHQRGSEYALPGKIFEYIGAGRPILAVTSDPLLSQLILEEKLGWVCANNKEDIKNCLENIYTDWLRGDLNRIIPRNINYEIGHIVGRLDEFLAEI